MKMKWRHDESGFSLLQVMGLLIVLTVSAVAIIDLMKSLWTNNTQGNLYATVSQLRLVAAAAIGNQDSWQRTISANPPMACIATKTCVPNNWTEISLVGIGWDGGAAAQANISAAPTANPSPLDIRPISFDNTYQRPPAGWLANVPAGFNPALAGYTALGTFCDAFTNAVGAGDPSCVLKIHVEWAVDCGVQAILDNNAGAVGSPCTSPYAVRSKLRIWFEYNPAVRVGTPTLNPERLRIPSDGDPTHTRATDPVYQAGSVRRNFGIKTADAECGAMTTAITSFVYMGDAAAITTPPNSSGNSYKNDARGCVDVRYLK